MQNLLQKSLNNTVIGAAIQKQAEQKYSKELIEKFALIEIILLGDDPDKVNVEATFKVDTKTLTVEEKENLAQEHLKVAELATMDDTLKLLNEAEIIMISVMTEFITKP